MDKRVKFIGTGFHVPGEPPEVSTAYASGLHKTKAGRERVRKMLAKRKEEERLTEKQEKLTPKQRLDVYAGTKVARILGQHIRKKAKSLGHEHYAKRLGQWREAQKSHGRRALLKGTGDTGRALSSKLQNILMAPYRTESEDERLSGEEFVLYCEDCDTAFELDEDVLLEDEGDLFIECPGCGEIYEDADGYGTGELCEIHFTPIRGIKGSILGGARRKAARGELRPDQLRDIEFVLRPPKTDRSRNPFLKASAKIGRMSPDEETRMRQKWKDDRAYRKEKRRLRS